MDLNALTAISPIDGRYRKQLQHLAEYFSEYALIRYRVRVEIEYFIALAEHKFFQLDASSQKSLRTIFEAFSLENAESIKTFEQTTNHDVKAVEYFLKEILDTMQLGQYKEWVHFGLTSQDINNTAIPLLGYGSLLVVFTIAFWPWLWLDPLGNFQTAFHNMAKFRHVVSMIFMGGTVTGDALPWYYIPVWIGITTPGGKMILLI
jgi:hypothetical protein